MTPPPTRRRLLAAGALPAALSLVGCGLVRRGGGPTDAEGPPTADGTRAAEPARSPDRCVSAAEAEKRSRPIPPERADVGPENEANPGVRMAAHGLALFADGERIAANRTSDAVMLGESDDYGTVVWSTADGSISERLDNGLVGAIAADKRGRLAIGGYSTVDILATDGKLERSRVGGDEPFGPRIGRLISDLAFTPDGSRLAALGADGRVTVWSVGGDAC